MGLLGKKQQCVVCGKELGLIKFRIAKDIYLCSDCNLKAGSNVKYIDINTVDIDDLKDKVKQWDERETENAKRLAQFQPTKKIGTFFAIDENKKQFSISNGAFSLNRIYNFSDVQSFELLEDGETISKGGLGRAVVGGALFGGVGAVVGGVTGGKKTKSICSKLQIKITVKDINNPIVYINLISSDTKKDSFVYKTLYNSAQEIMSILQLMTDENKDTQPQEVASTVSTADELKKYKDLLDSGAITEDEYNKVKSKLLGI